MQQEAPAQKLKNVAICKFEDSSAELKGIHVGNEQQHIHQEDRKKDNFINMRGLESLH